MMAPFFWGFEDRCAPVGAQGCPSEQGHCAPAGRAPGQGLCRLTGSALSLPRERPSKLRGEPVGGSRAGSLCCPEGAAWVTAAQTSTSPGGHLQRVILKRDVKVGDCLKGKKSVL